MNMAETANVTCLLLQESLVIPVEIDNSFDNSIQFREECIQHEREINVIYFDETPTSAKHENKVSDWSKSLADLPTFTIKEIERHRQLSGKIKGLSISKTLLRGRKFKEERYLTSDSVFTKVSKNNFRVKCKCKASMKKDIRNVEVGLNRRNGDVNYAFCDCPAGQSGYCNHVMALLIELAEYSLKGFKVVPKEVACTSTARQWGIPGEKDLPRAPIMSTTIKKQINKHGINSTLFDPRINHDNTTFQKDILQFKNKLQNEDCRIGFAHCIPDSVNYVKTKFGQFPLGSPLSFHLQPIEDSFKILTNITIANDKIIRKQDKEMCDLPCSFLEKTDKTVPTDWLPSDDQEKFLQMLQITEDMSKNIYKKTVKQSKCQEWFEYRKSRITSSNAHKVYVRQRNFETLTDYFTNNAKEKNLPKTVQDAMLHGQIYEPIAREIYSDAMKYKIQRNIQVNETGLVIQPHLYWLAASPDGLVRDDNDVSVFGLIEIKCPKSKRNMTPEEMVQDNSFYVGIENGKPYLKKKHSNGYYTQIQMALGLSRIQFCDFVVYSFTGMIIIRIPYDEEYFVNVVKKLNMFYKDYLLPKLMEKNHIENSVLDDIQFEVQKPNP